MDKHKEYCSEYESVKIQLPEKGTMLKFKHYHRSEKVPFIIYADLESFIKTIQTCDLDPEINYTKQYQKDEPSSFCYYIKCFDDKVFPPKGVMDTKRDDVAQVFIKMLEEDIKMICNIPMKEMIFGKKKYMKRKIYVGYVKENSMMMIIKIKRLGIIVILLVGIEELHIAYVILNIENKILHLWYFIILVGMIVIYL